MIDKISVKNNIINCVKPQAKDKNSNQNDVSFKGAGALELLLSGLQACEKNPMLNVAVVDLMSAILPRTIVESFTNIFAGVEAFRRESSGLLINCILPSYIVLACAACMNGAFMPKGANMSGCWADSKMVDAVKDIYKNAKSEDKIKESFKQILSGMEGFDGDKKVLFKEILTEKEIDECAEKLKELSTSKVKKKEFKEKIETFTKKIAEKTHVYENLNIAYSDKGVKTANLKSALTDATKFYSEFQKVENKIGIEEFAKKSKRMLRTKSLMGLSIVLPLAASMQYINRWITTKVTGVKGAPIYEDFGKDSNFDREHARQGLLKQKIISIASMLGVSLLSMSKLPSLSMLEFRGAFPSMDLARIISTVTFASRMAVADDKNELREATVRDIATFASLYFLGDYAAKITATILQKRTGETLLNETKKLDKDANIFKKIKHWVKDVNIKSSEEVFSKTAKKLKEANIVPNDAQNEIIKKELKRVKNLRSRCQFSNLVVSLSLLGFVIPICTRKNTKKKHAEALKIAQENNQNNIDNDVKSKTSLLKGEI